MKRDWDLVRRILAALESLGDTTSVLRADEISGYDPEVVSYHMQLLIEAGLADGNCREAMNAPLWCYLTRLTWEGHEFLDNVRSPTLWNRIKGVARSKGLELSFDVIKLAAKMLIEGMF